MGHIPAAAWPALALAFIATLAGCNRWGQSPHSDRGAPREFLTLTAVGSTALSSAIQAVSGAGPKTAQAFNYSNATDLQQLANARLREYRRSGEWRDSPVATAPVATAPAATQQTAALPHRVQKVPTTTEQGTANVGPDEAAAEPSAAAVPIDDLAVNEPTDFVADPVEIAPVTDGPVTDGPVTIDPVAAETTTPVVELPATKEAASTIADAAAAASDAAQPWLAHFDALRHEDPRVRAGAALALAEFGAEHPEVVSELLTLFEDEDRDVVVAARRALREIGPAAVDALGQALRGDDHEVRRFAIYALRRFPPEVALPALEELLTVLREDDGEIRAAAATALGHIGFSPEVRMPPLVDALSDSEPLVRESAARSLMLIGAEAKPAVPALERLRDDPSYWVRDAVRQALRSIAPGPRKQYATDP